MPSGNGVGCDRGVDSIDGDTTVGGDDNGIWSFSMTLEYVGGSRRGAREVVLFSSLISMTLGSCCSGCVVVRFAASWSRWNRAL